jgi:hypothetical protein
MDRGDPVSIRGRKTRVLVRELGLLPNWLFCFLAAATHATSKIPAQHGTFCLLAIKSPSPTLSPRNPYLSNGGVVLTTAVSFSPFPRESSVRESSPAAAAREPEWSAAAARQDRGPHPPGTTGGCPSPQLKIDAHPRAPCVPRLDLARRSGLHRQRGPSPPGPARELAEAPHGR